jgi:hypothetical protein
MLLRQFAQYILGLVFLVSGSLALSNTEFTYNVIDGGIEFTGCVDECPSDLVIPAEIDGYEVISIIDEAFYVPERGDEGYDEFASVLTSLTLPNTIRYIGRLAFAGNSISNVTIPSSVREISPGAFNGCELDTLVIENGVQYLREGAFYHNNLTNVIIPESVIEIGRTVFSRNQLVEITIPKNVTSIGDRAFENNELVTINFSGNRPEIYQNIFFDTNTTFMGNQIQNIHYCSGTSGWPGESIEGITPELDESCEYSPPQESHFTYNIMDEGIEITGCADGCPSDLVIPEEIDGYSVVSIDHWAFAERGLISVTMPSNVTSIGEYAFSRNQLASLSIPDSVTIIHEGAFYENQLNSVTIPESVTTIWGNAFAHNQLTSVNIPNSLSTIVDSVFFSNQLTSVTIPNSVTRIEYSAFASNQLISVNFVGNFPEIDFNSFAENPGISSEEFRYLPLGDRAIMLGCVDLCPSDLVIPNKVDSYDVIGIDNFAFENNQLTTVSIPDGIDFIGLYAFGNNQLTTLHIPNSVSFIDNAAFRDNQLTSVHLSNSLASIEGDTFSNNQLASLTIPNNVTMILESAFAGNQLTSVSIPDSISVIREKTFENNQLTSVAISNSVTAIDAQAFANNQLTEVTIPQSVRTIENSAFSNNQLTSVSIPDSITKIGARAFENNQLENISFSGNRPQMSNEGVVWASFGDGAFIGDGAEMVGNTFMFPSTAQEWAGFANDNPDIYPLSFPDGGTISFTASSEQPVNVKFKFEFRPWPDVNPDFETALIEVNGACASYSVDFPSQGDNTYSSFLMFVVERDIPVTVENVVINGDAPACEGDNNNDVSTSFIGNPIQNIQYCLGASGWPGESIEGITPELDESCEYSPPQESHFTYNILDEGIEITGCIDECPSDLVIPEEIDGYTVISIGAEAFISSGLSSVLMPNTIIIIGAGAFVGNELRNVIIPNSVTTIHHSAFEYNWINSLTIPDSVNYISNWAFAGNNLIDIDLPENIEVVSTGAFARNQITNLYIPNGVSRIEHSAFMDNQIMSLELSEGIQSIEEEAFKNNNLINVIMPESIAYIGVDAFFNNPLTNVTFCGEWGLGSIEGITPQLDENCYSPLDLDQNGSFEALTDALILLRYAFGLRGENLINGAIATDANRTSAEDIEAHIQSLLP